MSLNPQFGIGESVSIGANYARLASDTTRVLWECKWMIAAFMVAFPVLAFIGLVLIGPRYTAETMIELGFNRTTGAGVDSRVDTKTALDASVLVDSAARVLRSRSIAGAVVTRLGLDKDPRYTRNPLFLEAVSFARAALGLPHAELTPHDQAVNELLRRISVAAQPRSYLISIAATAEKPEPAMALVNSVVSAYLQSRMLQEVSAAANEMKQASTIYGVRHPQYQNAQMKLRRAEAELNALGEKLKGGTQVVAGDSFMAGDVVVGPSSAQIEVTLSVALVIGLACGIWTVLHKPAIKGRLKAMFRKIRVQNRKLSPIGR
jgi:capsular polysaccharide biosynthesis protein